MTRDEYRTAHRQYLCHANEWLAIAEAHIGRLRATINAACVAEDIHRAPSPMGTSDLNDTIRRATEYMARAEAVQWLDYDEHYYHAKKYAKKYDPQP